MRLLKCLLFVFAAAGTFTSLGLDLDLRQAYRAGAVANVRGQVVDEEGEPLPGAIVTASFLSLSKTDDDVALTAGTDGKGLFELSGRTNWKVECVVSKDGYYESRYEVSLGDTLQNTVKDGAWQNKDLSRKIVLRKRVGQKSLVVFPERNRMGRWKIPEMGKWVGFDFECFDWVVPYGRGIQNDVLLRFSAQTSRQIFGKYQMEVCFTNNPFAGAYRGKGDPLSDLKIPHMADARAVYMPYHCFKRNNMERVKEDTFPGKDDYLVFRTRTVVNEQGRLEKACYGIISGTWASGDVSMRIEDAAFNVEPNDLNIEDGYYLRQRVRRYKNQRLTTNDGVQH